MFAVIDIETTGLNHDVCEIIQFSALLFSADAKFIRSENLYFYKEGMHWDQKVSDEVHKITLDDLKKHKDDYEKNIAKMFTVMNKVILVGHNAAAFDVPFISRWFERNGLTPPEYTRVEDTMLFMKPLYKRSRIKLTKLMDMVGISDDSVAMMGEQWFGEQYGSADHHNAMYDTTATALITLYAIRNNFVDILPVSIGEALRNGAKIQSRVSLAEVGDQWLDDNHVHYVELKRPDGSYLYFATCNSPDAFSPPEYTSKDAMPKEALDRLLPVTFASEEMEVIARAGEATLYLHNLNNTYYIRMVNNGTSIDSSVCSTRMFASTVRTLAKCSR